MHTAYAARLQVMAKSCCWPKRYQLCAIAIAQGLEVTKYQGQHVVAGSEFNLRNLGCRIHAAHQLAKQTDLRPKRGMHHIAVHDIRHETWIAFFAKTHQHASFLRHRATDKRPLRR